MKVRNMESSQGNKIANQFVIETSEGTYFQSYRSIISLIPYFYSPSKPVNERMPHEKIMLDEHYWDYSVTTGKYRNLFLGQTKKETEAKIESGEYILTDLNK